MAAEGLVRYPDGRREPEAFLCTDTGADPRDVLDCFNRRWAVETTYEEARAHLGMETQRQWSDPAIFRYYVASTPSPQKPNACITEQQARMMRF